jgi:hypothetical protein
MTRKVVFHCDGRNCNTSATRDATDAGSFIVAMPETWVEISLKWLEGGGYSHGYLCDACALQLLKLVLREGYGTTEREIQVRPSVHVSNVEPETAVVVFPGEPLPGQDLEPMLEPGEVATVTVVLDKVFVARGAETLPPLRIEKIVCGNVTLWEGSDSLVAHVERCTGNPGVTMTMRLINAGDETVKITAAIHGITTSTRGV